MAVVKMSEFDLVVLNESVDSLLKTLQKFENIVFSDNLKPFDSFKKPASTYNFDENLSKRDHIQSVLKHLNNLKKKEQKGSNSLFKDLGMHSLSLRSIESIVEQTNLESLLTFYAENYEGDNPNLGSFRIISSKKTGSFDDNTLNSLMESKPIIGNVSDLNIDKVVQELIGVENVVVMYQPALVDKKSIIVILTTPEFRQTCRIIAQKHDIELRSAQSLHIEDKINGLTAMLRNVLEKHQSINERVSSLGFYQEILMAHYESLSHEELREKTKLLFLESEFTTYIKGWVMSEDVEAFKSLIHNKLDTPYDLEITEAPLHSLEVPIKLRNGKFASAFELITNMYSQPRYDEPDPTPIFAPFYAFFFGMMLGDLGYGLIMGIVMFGALKLINLKPGIQSIVRMLMYVSIPTMFWGIVYGSFFGGLIPMTPIIDINNDFNTVLVMALFFGISHLFVALGVRAYIYLRDYKLRYVLYDVVFWYMTLIGSIMLVSQMFTSIMTPYNFIAIPLTIIGMVGIVLTNGRDAKTPFGKAVSGLYSLYGLTNYVGDIVSYSRLMALGLAGASIGVAFNMMVSMVSGMGVLSVIFGSIIFLIGHTFNLLISGLSSYVHAARLTYVEFFGKFFVGGGKPFKPFVANPTYIKLEKE